MYLLRGLPIQGVLPVRVFAFLLASSLLTSPAMAQDAPVTDESGAPAASETEQASPSALSVHDDEHLIVTGIARELDVLAGKSVISGDELQRDIRVQIGDSLTSLPGVSATSFSPGSSRPVLRGLQGERVRVLTDGIGSIDVSNTSADHAVTIDPLTAERIEVLRGPAVLLYGSQASGGAVNVIDRRIPRRAPETYHVDVVGALGTAANERSVGAAFDVALGDSGFVLHADGSFRKTDDLRTGEHLLSPELRAEQLEIAEEELEEGHFEEAEEALDLANRKGKIPNSQTEQKSGGLGLAYIKGPLSVGVSISRFESNYGVPSRPGAEHHHEGGGEEEDHGEAPVTIDLGQTRYDLRAQYEFAGGFLDHVALRLGHADYEHTEFEGDEVGTVFSNKGSEGRLELVQRDRNGWRGASGAQYYQRDFDAVGAEAFLPPNDTSQFGLFTVQELKLGGIGLELGGRYEHTAVEDKLNDLERDFDAFSIAGGAFVAPAERVKLGVNLSRTERAPSAEELFSNGPHIATQSFEIGDPDLKKEKATGLEAYVRVERSAFEVSATAFATWFDDFIFEAATGDEDEETELPVFQYFQRGATFYGFELEGSARLFRAGAFTFVADGVADYVRAKLDGAGPVPRIPPLRLLGGLEAQSDRIDGRVEVEWTADQNRVAGFENPTEGFTLVNASVAWRPWGKARETTLLLSANNIFDVEARRHASLTKDFVPLAGRDIRLSARFSF
jgi:iron complex outermembrane receptor protein